MKLLQWLLLPPVVIAALWIAVANRHQVTLSLDPFNPAKPALGMEIALVWLLFAATLAGMLIGGLAVWIGARRRQALKSAPPPMQDSRETSRKLESLPALRD